MGGEHLTFLVISIQNCNSSAQDARQRTFWKPLLDVSSFSSSLRRRSHSLKAESNWRRPAKLASNSACLNLSHWGDGCRACKFLGFRHPMAGSAGSRGHCWEKLCGCARRSSGCCCGMEQQLSFGNRAQRKPTRNNSSPEISAREGGLSVAENRSLRSTLLCLFLARPWSAREHAGIPVIGPMQTRCARGEFFSSW